MQRPDVTVVVLGSADRPVAVETCLLALHPTLGAHDEVLLLPEDESAVGGASLFPWVAQVAVPAAASAAQGADAAMEQARHSVVILLAGDVVVTPDWLGRLLAPLRDFSVAAVSPRAERAVVAPADIPGYAPTSVADLVEYSQDWHWSHLGERTDTQSLDAFCVALRVSAWRAVGGFSAGDRPGVDLQPLCGRLIEGGWTLLVADDTLVHRSTPGSAFDDVRAVRDFRRTHEERQLRRTQELGGAVAFDQNALRQQFAGEPLPPPAALVVDESAEHPGPRPRITVIVPTFNRPKLLRRALESIEAQTVHAAGVGVEVIVVNDGGSDVRPVAREFVDSLDLRVLHAHLTRGRAAACNWGLRAARGELVNVLDDDDVMYPHHLQTLLDAYDAEPGPRVLVRSYAVVTTLSEKRGALLRGVVGDQPLDGGALAVGNTLAGLTVLAPVDLLRREGGFDERLPLFDDWELWLRLTRLGVQVREVALPTAEMFRHDRRVGAKEIRRVHDALLHVYRQHPVARGSSADEQRLTRLGESMRGSQAYPLDVSVVVAASSSPGSPEVDLHELVATLKSCGAAMTGGRWELLLVVPQAVAVQSVFDQLEGDVRVFSVGEMESEEALRYGESRAGGRHVLLLAAGEVLDVERMVEVLSSVQADAHRIGVPQSVSVRPVPV